MGKKKEVAVTNSDQELNNTPEGRKKLEEKRILALKSRESQEEKLSNKSFHKLQSQFFDSLRTNKSSQLSNQLSALQSAHLSNKIHADKLSLQWQEELEECGDQLKMARHGHLIQLEEMMKFCLDKVDKEYDWFNQDLQDIETEFNTEKDLLSANHLALKKELTSVLGNMCQELQELENESNQEYTTQKEEMKNKNMEEKQAMRIMIETAMEELWRSFQKSLDEYHSNTEERKLQFEQLRQKDLTTSQLIDTQSKKLLSLSNQITFLKHHLQTQSRDHELQLKTLKNRKDVLQRQFQEMKYKMGLFREEERKKLKELTCLSHGVVEGLKEKKNLAERILSVGILNEKYEKLEDDLHLPIHDHETLQQIEAVEKKIQDSFFQPEEKQEEESQQTFYFSPKERMALLQFYNRYNKIKLSTLQLQQHKDKLKQENTEWREAVKQVFSGMTLKEGNNDNSKNVGNAIMTVKKAGEIKDKEVKESNGKDKRQVPYIEGRQILSAQRLI